MGLIGFDRFCISGSGRCTGFGAWDSFRADGVRGVEKWLEQR